MLISDVPKVSGDSQKKVDRIDDTLGSANTLGPIFHKELNGRCKEGE
jgi:hypothetical protein